MGLYLALLNLAGDRTDAGVDKDHSIGVADRLHQLGSELVQRENLHVRIPDDGPQALGGVPAHSIVAPQRVAVAED